MARPIKQDRPFAPAWPGILLAILVFIISAIATGCSTTPQSRHRQAFSTALPAFLTHLSETRRMVVSRAVESIGADYT